ncbi:perchlorate reductase subunit gamma precursor [bacterium BMS3Abin04]|nr:perchlorate reductase subunit gamma precursor [bacterium BMS3Abin04]
MKTLKTLSYVFFIFLFAVSVNNISAQKKAHKYIGVKKCSMCHKSKKIGDQYKIWKKTKHAQAYKTLQTKEADKIAADKGFKTKAVDTPECLECHAPTHSVKASLIGKKFKIEDGVQCETCHGPGSDYKSNKIMKDRDKAIANGLHVYKTEDDKEKLCGTCHNKKSPTFKEFKFEERWEKIKHTVPTKG